MFLDMSFKAVAIAIDNSGQRLSFAAIAPLPKIHLKVLTNQICFASQFAFTETLFAGSREIGNCTLMPPQQERLRLTAYSKVSSNALGIYKWLMAEKLCRQYPIDFPG
jgi:hypothetical protein